MKPPISHAVSRPLSQISDHRSHSRSPKRRGPLVHRPPWIQVHAWASLHRAQNRRLFPYIRRGQGYEFVLRTQILDKSLLSVTQYLLGKDIKVTKNPQQINALL